MSEGKARAWVVTLHRVENEAGEMTWRHQDVAYIKADVPAAAVAFFMERWYAAHYLTAKQQWYEAAAGKTDTAARMSEGIITVGRGPELRAELVEDLRLPDARADA